MNKISTGGRHSMTCTYFVAFWLILSAGLVHAKDLGRVGKVYPVKERDALEELEARAAKVNWKKHLDKIKPEKYRPGNLVGLPRATKTTRRLVDMTYTLDMDVPDGKGGIVYPKGYSFNPLDYLPFRKILVIINPDDPDQLHWFKSSEYATRIDVMPLITQGSAVGIGKAISRPVFYADSRIIDKFDVRSVPAVVRQSGRMMEVTEYYVNKTNHKTVSFR